MRTKRTTIFACFLLACIMIFNSCAFLATPTDVTTQFLDALKAQDKETIEKIYAGQWDGEGDITAAFNAADLGALSQDTVDKFLRKVLAFDYELGEEKITDNTATVDVTINAYNFTGAFSNVLESLYSEAIRLAFSGLDEEELDKEISKLVDSHLSQQLDELETKDKSATVTVELVKEGGKWQVQPLSEEFMDALFGGLNSFIAKGQ